MANFQFGKDNVGAGWGNLPSGYVQGMSVSPMATGISGIAAAIANAAQQYQQARQNAFMEQLKQKQLDLQQTQTSGEFNLGQQRIDIQNKQLELEKLKQQLEQKRLAEADKLSSWAGLIGPAAQRYLNPELPQQASQPTAQDQPSMQLFPPYGLELATPPQYNLDLGNPSMMYGQYPQY